MRLIPLALLISWLLPASAFAWGERGHDLVTRVAVRMLMHDATQHLEMTVPFRDKEHMLAHLSNVPDIHWRNVEGVGKEATKFNGPTHFVDIEYLSPAATFADFPKTVAAAEAKMAKLCQEKSPSYVCPVKGDGNPQLWQAGSAPWRIAQLINGMTAAFQKAKAAHDKTDVKGVITATNQALLWGGLAAHFIGDLGNPHHSSRDYDGWEIGQGGVHAYFETEIVNAFDLTLDQEVLDWAIKNRPANRFAELLSKPAAVKPDAFNIAVALTLDSFSRLSIVNEIDRAHAVTKASKIDGGLKIKADRKNPNTVAKHFRPMIVERLATAADALARLWKLAWIQGGKPDLSGFQSYDYPLAPDFIKLNYSGSGLRTQ